MNLQKTLVAFGALGLICAAPVRADDNPQNHTTTQNSDIQSSQPMGKNQSAGTVVGVDQMHERAAIEQLHHTNQKEIRLGRMVNSPSRHCRSPRSAVCSACSASRAGSS